MCTLLPCLICTRSSPPVRHNAVSVRTRRWRILRAVLEIISSSDVTWIPLTCFLTAANNQKLYSARFLWHVSWQLQTTRSYTVPNLFDTFLYSCKQPEVIQCQISLTCFLTAAKNQKLYGAKFLWHVSWQLQTTRSYTVPNPGCRECVKLLQIWCPLSVLKWVLALPCWRSTGFSSRRKRLIHSFFLPLESLHVSLAVEFRRPAWILSSNFCLFKSRVAVTGIPDCGWSFGTKFPPLSLNIITQRRTVLVSTVFSPQKANNRRWIPVRVSFSWVKNSLTVCSLMRFDTVDKE